MIIYCLLIAETKFRKDFDNNKFLLLLVKNNTMGRKKKDNKDLGRNVRISTKTFLLVKKFAEENNQKIGGFVEASVLENLKKANNGA